MTKAIRQPTKAMRHYIKVDRYTASASATAFDQSVVKTGIWRPDHEVLMSNRTLVIHGTYFDPFEDEAIWNGNPVEITVYQEDREIKTFKDAYIDPSILTNSMGTFTSMSLKPDETHYGYCFIPPKAHGYMQELLFAGQGKFLSYLGTKIKRNLLISFIQLMNDISCEE